MPVLQRSIESTGKLCSAFHPVLGHLSTLDDTVNYVSIALDPFIRCTNTHHGCDSGSAESLFDDLLRPWW